MPEGPEHYKASVLINCNCKDRIFYGKVNKSAVSEKNPDVDLPFERYTVSSRSRGKELMLTLARFVGGDAKERKVLDEKTANIKKEKEEEDSKSNDCKTNENEEINIIFQFGMSGKFSFTPENELEKHSHLTFHTEHNMVLSFVDSRRFGRWRVDKEFSSSRGPDPWQEHQAFRENIVNNLDKSVFDKPICRVLHDQKYFNGVGNYLRAEILYRAEVPPFSLARDVLKNIATENKDSTPDLLNYCRIVYEEISVMEGAGYDKNDVKSYYSRFENWLQCYGKANMKNLVDQDGRTIWFKGEAGKLAPKGEKAVSRKVSKKQKSSDHQPAAPKRKKAESSHNSRRSARLKTKLLLA